ncbi:MAG: PD40 domain-containing protein [Armatimonadetes bacterium]|nr:PD40 domain-containing protein [Armatimonadota bacterium]
MAVVLVCAGRWTAPRSLAPSPPAAPRTAPAQLAAPVLQASWRLLFARDVDTWVAAGDGSGQRLLIRHAQSPCWSPDHKAIAFVRAGQVWTANAEGGNLRQLTAMPYDEVPVEDGWSSDGRPVDLTWDPVDDAIFFSRSERFHLAAVRGDIRPFRQDQPREQDVDANTIFRVSAAAIEEAAPEVCWDLLDYNTHVFTADFGHPAWSADGRRLALCSKGDVWYALRSEPPEGAGFILPPREKRLWNDWDWQAARLAAVADYDLLNRGDAWVCLATHLSWSPDGKRLAYGMQRVGGSGFAEVHVVDVRPDGEDHLASSGDRTLAEYGMDPCFSPDGKWVAYSGSPAASVDEAASDGLRGIVVTPARGGSRRLLVAGGAQPAW